MKITGLRSFMARDRDRPRVLVAIDTDEGITGWGECYNHGPDRALPPLLDYLYLQIAGEDPRRIERLVLKMLQHARFPPGALGLAGISAIDHALWDISAKALGVPVYMLLGGNVCDAVRCRAVSHSHRNAHTTSRPLSTTPTCSTFPLFGQAQWRYHGEHLFLLLLLPRLVFCFCSSLSSMS